MQNTENELIKRSLQNDADAYGELVERYKNAIYYHCYSIVRDEDVAEDLAQEAFINGYYKLKKFDESKKFSTWLFKIATNKCLDYLRSRKKIVDVDDEIFDSILTTERSVEDKLVDRELHDAIKTLDPKYQTVINLHYFEGLAYEDIAERMDAPIGSVRGWLHRAKNDLRKELA